MGQVHMFDKTPDQVENLSQGSRLLLASQEMLLRHYQDLLEQRTILQEQQQALIMRSLELKRYLEHIQGGYYSPAHQIKRTPHS